MFTKSQTVKAGKGLELMVEASEIPEPVQERIFWLGMKTALRNVHAGEPDKDEANAKSRAKLAAFYGGEFAGKGEATATKTIEKALGRFTPEELQAALDAAQAAPESEDDPNSDDDLDSE